MSNSQHPVVSSAMSSAESTTVDLLIVPVIGSKEDELKRLKSLDLSGQGAIARAFETGEFANKRNQTLLVELHGGDWKARRALLVGTRERYWSTPNSRYLEDGFRYASAVGARIAGKLKVTTVGVLFPGKFVRRWDGKETSWRKDWTAKAAIEGIAYGGFSDSRYRKSEEHPAKPPAYELVWSEGCIAEDLTESIRYGNATGRSVNIAREFANDPANILTPRVFAERAESLCKESGLHTEVLDEAAIEELAMGLLLGVARGSEEPPRLLVMRYEPPEGSDITLGLVGKGVTFDSGGISIKPAGGMERMKSDMSGGAAVIGSMCAIAEIGAPVRVIGLVPMTENMPSGLATKPGDILTSADGTTVEIINTDAEGRLILADALWYAQKLGATHLVDVATLTGACVVALGKVASGIFGEPHGWVHSIAGASERAGERLWHLPLYSEYRGQLESELADIKNIGGREGGACTAAAFLQCFTNGKPWAHLDIAGTAWTEASSPDGESGATGVMVRTMVKLATSTKLGGLL